VTPLGGEATLSRPAGHRATLGARMTIPVEIAGGNESLCTAGRETAGSAASINWRSGSQQLVLCHE